MEITDCDSEEHPRRAVRDYVAYYRFEREHSSLGSLAPDQFARGTMLKTAS